MDAGNASRPPAGPPVFNASGRGGAAAAKGGNQRRLEEQLLQDNAASAAGFYGARPALGMYGNDPNRAQLGSLYAAGLGNQLRLGMPGQFDENLASLQAGGLGNIQQQQRIAAQQQAAAAANGVDFQGLMPTGFDGSDASALLGNPAAMAGYPFQAGFNAAAVGLGVDGAPGPTGLLNANRNMQNAAQFGNANPVGSLFDQGYNFARSEMALVRHQAALTNNAALMGGANQAGFNLAAAGLDRRYGNYGAADPSMMGAANDPSYLGRDGNAAATGHLATIPAIRLAQHRNTLQRRMMVNNLPERKDGSFPVVLYQESDEHKLTAYQCLLRKQLELFEADEDDVRCSTRQGRTAPIKLGQVGLRCRHCAGVQLAARTKGAAYYSQTVEGIYQIAQNMSKVHLCERCYRIPRDVRRQLIVLRSDCRRAIGGKEYWSENIRALGVYVDEGILRVKKAPKEEAKDDEKKEGDSEKKEDSVKEESKEDDKKEETPKEVASGEVKKEETDAPMEEEKEETPKEEEKTEAEEKPIEDGEPKEEDSKKEDETMEEDKKEETPPTEEKDETPPTAEEKTEEEPKEGEEKDAMEVEGEVAAAPEEEKKPEEEDAKEAEKEEEAPKEEEKTEEKNGEEGKTTEGEEDTKKGDAEV